MRRPSPGASAHQELGLNFLPLPSLLSSPSASLGCTGGRDGLPQHLVPYSLESLYELFAALDPLP